MAIKSKNAQDRRINSRVIARLDCTITYEKNSYEAVIVDLSLKSAMLSSKFGPPTGSEITITLQTPHLKNSVLLRGKVLRGAPVMSEHGPMNRYAVRFGRTPPDLIVLLNKLIAL
jgi:hypothetical protein